MGWRRSEARAAGYRLSVPATRSARRRSAVPGEQMYKP